MGLALTVPIADCTQTKVVYKNRKLRRLPLIILPVTPIILIDFSGNRITDLPHDLRCLHLLNLANNGLTYFNNFLISAINTYQSLSIFVLSQNELSEFPESFCNLPLTTLNLQENDFEDFDYKIPTLQVLNLMNNELTSFTAVLNSLNQLNLSFNYLNTLNFTSNTLTMLAVSGNNIEVIPDMVLPNLTVLDISLNKLVDISNITKFAPKLQIFNFSFNEVTEINDLPETLTILNGNNNHIKELPQCIYTIPKLNEVSLMDNELEKVGEFKQSLGFLLLKGNRIKKIGRMTVNCPILNLSDNLLEDIPDMSHCTTKKVDLHSNRIKTIDLSHLPRQATMISLRDNLIEEVPDKLFYLGYTLVDLNQNLLTSLPETLAESIVDSLFLCYNKFTAIPQLPKTLATLKMADNELTNIDCITKYSSIETIDVNGNKIEVFPDSDTLKNVSANRNRIKKFPNLPSAENVDFSFNMIEEANTYNATYVDLSHNNLTSVQFSENVVSIKLSFNPIVIDLDLPKYTKLDSIDLCGCKEVKFTPSMTAREVITSDPKLHPSEGSSTNKLFDYEGAGYSEMQGYRATMEDSIIVRRKQGLFAVLDGHGGFQASLLASAALPVFLDTVGYTTGGLCSAILGTQRLLLTKNVADGTTLCCILLTEDKIICANIGDSRCIGIKKDGSFVLFSEDHKPYTRSEVERIREEKSFVFKGRVGARLALSRSLGDFNLKGVTCSPDIKEFNKSEFRRVVIGCDGLFDMVSNECVAEFAATDDPPALVACKLRDLAFSRASEDNISVLVVDI